jgi:hypothetical protein
MSVPEDALLGDATAASDGPRLVPVDELFLDGVAVRVIANLALTLVAVEVGERQRRQCWASLSFCIYTSIAHFWLSCKGRIYMVLVLIKLGVSHFSTDAPSGRMEGKLSCT